MNYQTKPVQVEAIQWNGGETEVGWVLSRYPRADPRRLPGGLSIFTSGGHTIVTIGGWLVFDGKTLTAYGKQDFKNKYEELNNA